MSSPYGNRETTSLDTPPVFVVLFNIWLIAVFGVVAVMICRCFCKLGAYCGRGNGGVEPGAGRRNQSPPLTATPADQIEVSPRAACARANLGRVGDSLDSLQCPVCCGRLKVRRRTDSSFFCISGLHCPNLAATGANLANIRLRCLPCHYDVCLACAKKRAASMQTDVSASAPPSYEAAMDMV